MSNEKFLRCHDVTAKWEGGWSDHPADPGGKTMYGVTEARWHEYQANRGVPRTPVRNITKDQAVAFYMSEFWRPARGEELPSGADLTVYDGSVNSGVSRSVKWAQQVAGVAVDGKAGAQTIAAIKAMRPDAFVKAHCAKRLGFVKSLAIWNTFGKGWSRRIANVEATALSWVLTKAQMEAEAKAAQERGNQQAGGAVVVTGGAVGDQASGLSGLPLWAIAGAVVLIVTILIIRIVINNQRSHALAKAAKEAL